MYEEQLFRSEDERFELDMVIECGASAIRAMAPLAAQLGPLPPDIKANWRLPTVRACSVTNYNMSLMSSHNSCCCDASLFTSLKLGI